METIGVEFGIANNALHISITHEVKGSCVYGFEIYCDGEMIEDIKWIAQREIRYPLEQDGDYRAVCLMKCDGKQYTAYTQTEAYPADSEFKLPVIEDAKELDVTVSVDNGTLKAEANLDTDAAYAVYRFDVIRDNAVEREGKWGAKKSCTDELDRDGEYQVEVWVETDKARYGRRSAAIAYQRKITCNVHGSLASTRIIEGRGDGRISLANYFSRQPVLGELMQTGVDASTIAGVFSRTIFDGIRMKLLVNRAEYLIIDFLDETIYGASYKNLRGTDAGFGAADIDKAADNYIKRYCESFLEANAAQKIIIHKAYFLDSYIDKRGNIKPFDSKVIAQNTVYNEILRVLYDKLAALMPEAAVIDICKDFRADESVADGLSPLHCEKAYYEKAYEMLESAITVS